MRTPPIPLARWTVFVLLAVAAVAAPPARAMDQILLKSGTRVTGTVLGQSKDEVFMRIGAGNAVFKKRAILRIYEDITNEPPLTRVLRRDELPPWFIALSDLYHEDWVNTMKSVPAELIPDGEFRHVPYLSFRFNAIYELNIFGDPADPAAIQIGYHGDIWFRSGDAQKRCRQFIASYLGGVRQFEALYRMDATGGRETVSGLVIQIIPRGAPDSRGGWWVTVWNPAKLAATRRVATADWKPSCDQLLARIDRSTDGEREWTKYSFQDAAKRYLPLERMEER